MELLEVWKNFAPGFVGGLMSAILLAIMLGHKPSKIGWGKLSLLVVGLFIAGIFFTWLILFAVN